MTIEQEFFEAFGIEPKCLNEEYSGCKYANDDNRKCCKQYKDKTCNYSYFWIYPPITPEIVLGLEDILIKHTFAYINMEGRKIVENAPFGYIHKYGLYECHCGISSKHEIGKGKTRIEALLKLCIQLKDEIQDQVKALFKC